MKLKNRPVGLRQIATACSVSLMTVSRALRLDPRVASDVRARILAAAERLGYHSKIKAGRPRGRVIAVRHEDAVLIVISTAMKSDTFYYVNLLFALEQELSAHDLQCMILTCDGQYESFRRLGERIRRLSVQGIFFVGALPPAQLRTLLEIVPRMILVDQPGDPELGPDCESVAFDNVAAARLAVGHLLDIGRRRILLIRGDPAHYFSREMEQGYRAVLSARGQAPDARLIKACDYTAEGAARTVSHALRQELPFDAVFTNDEMACGVLQALHAAGKRVPQDVAVSGCDGLALGAYVYPRLTTVRLDCRELSRAAVERVLAVRKGAGAPRRVRLIPQLEIRESTQGVTVP